MASTIAAAGQANIYPVSTAKKPEKNGVQPQESKPAPGSHNDPNRVLDGVFTEEQMKFLEEIKNDPTNKRMIDNQALGKDQFMHILLKQLANQNPLNPMQDKDFIAQMAQFSSLEGMQKLNKTFEGLSKDIKSIKDLLGAQGAGKADFSKIQQLLEGIAKKLGVEIAPEKPKEEGKDKKSEEAGKAEGTDKAENTEQSEKAEKAEKPEAKEGASKPADPKEELNKGIAKQNAVRAYE